MGLFADLIGTTKAAFQIAIGGVKLGNSAGNLTIKDNAGDDSDVTAKKAFLSGDEIEINSDAAASGADWKMKLARPASGMTEEVVFTFPPTPGSPNQLVKTDGAGNLDFVTGAEVQTQNVSVDATALAFDSSPTVAMFNLPVGAVVELIRVIIDTPFSGSPDPTPTLSIGVAGVLSKYMASTQVNLKGTAKDIYESKPAEAAIAGSPEAVITTYVADGATAGAARIEVHYSIPT